MNLDPKYELEVGLSVRWPLAFGFDTWRYRSTMSASWGRYWSLGLGLVMVTVRVTYYEAGK